MTITSSGLGSKAINTFALLDQIMTVLGTTNTTFWPFLNGAGAKSFPYGSSSYTTGLGARPLTTNASTLELVFDPVRHPGGIHSYQMNSASANLAAADAARFSFGDATVDSPFSIGVWILLQEGVDTLRSIMAKYGSTGTLREYDFRYSATGKLIIELYDESTDSTEIATSVGTALVAGVWQFVTMTYDGGETAPVVNLYINAVSVHDGTTVEAGAGYEAMEDTAAVLMLGSRDAAGTAAQVFQGRMALPFITGTALTAAQVSTLYGIGKILLGI